MRILGKFSNVRRDRRGVARDCGEIETPSLIIWKSVEALVVDGVLLEGVVVFVVVIVVRTV